MIDPPTSVARLAQFVLPLHAQPELDQTVALLLRCARRAVDCSHASVWLCRVT